MVSEKRKRERSPSYPDIDLEEALGKAQKIWVVEKRNWAPITAIQQHWGYGPNTGPGLRALAALKKFGLLGERGRGEHRQVQLSELALKILLDQRSEDSEEKQLAIKESALTPPIHRQLWEEYKETLPSDATLKYKLVTDSDLPFSERGATALIEEYKATIAFAKLTDYANIAPGDADKDNDEKESGDSEGEGLFGKLPNPFVEQHKKMEEPETKARQQRIIQVPIGENEWVALQLPSMMSETEWQQMQDVLLAMKPALVGPISNQPEAKAG